MSIFKDVFLMFLMASLVIAALMGLGLLASLAVKATVLHLPYWSWFVAFPCIGGAFVVLLALVMSVLDFR